MRKWLPLLFIAAFAICAGSVSIYAQTVSSSSFIAEVSFLGIGSGTFGFTLYQSTSDALPNGTAGESVSTNTINWIDTGVTAGQSGFTNSRVYALLEHDLVGSQVIFIYTDNVNGDKYKFSADSVAANPADVSSFVETKKPGAEAALIPAHAIDLAYIIISSVQYNEAARSKNGNANGPAGISDIYIGLAADSVNANYGTGFALDKSKSAVANDGRGHVIANVNGYWYGDTHYDYKPGINTYMFFSANFEKARKGFYYGTDTLTIELADSL
jgi:hypothetical protein